MNKLILMITSVLALALASCPAMPRPDGCAPNDQRCHDGVPQVCSSTERWTPADGVCSEHGGVCCLTRSEWNGGLIFACVPANRCSDADGGAP